MKIPVKTLKSGFSMPVFGLGTWRMGGDRKRDPHNNDEADIKAIRQALEAGITHIDTAERYADGKAEELIAEAKKGFNRNDLFLVSKVAPDHLHYDQVISAIEGTLKRLQTDYIDLYLVHQPNDEVPIAETMRAMNKLVDEGLIKNIGVSNFKNVRVDEAQKYAKHQIVCNQLHYNLKVREIERNNILAYANKNDMMITAWRPLEKGMIMERNDVLVEMAKKYDKTEAQIAINWLISQENIVTLSKMSNPIHLEENLGAIGWKMEKEDIEFLRKEFPNQLNISEAVPLE